MAPTAKTGSAPKAGGNASERDPRVNMTATLPVSVKARVKAYAKYHNNAAARIVENGILMLLGTWGTDDDDAPDALRRRALVAEFLEIERGRSRS